MEGMGLVYLALLIPLLVTGIFYMFKKHEFTWWEFFVPIAAVALIIFGTVKITEKTATSFTEYWGSTVMKIYEQEPYNYWQHQTCTRQVASGTDANGNTTYRTETYDCSHQVDVGPSWDAVTNLDEHIGISEELYDELLVQFGTGRQVTDTHKNHDSGDRAVRSKGTKFQGTKVGKTSNQYGTAWGGQDHTRKAYTSKHKYINKVKASDLSIFNIEVVNKNEADSLGLYDIPDQKKGNMFKLGNGFEFPTIIGDSTVSEETQEMFRRLNGKYGVSNEMRLWVLVYEDKPSITGVMQENYWVKGNMNELTICIGVSGEEIEWAHAFSWATSNTLTVEVADAVRNLYTYKDSTIKTPAPPVLNAIIQTAQPDKTIRVKSSKTPVLNEQTWSDLYTYLNGNLTGFERRDVEEEFDYVKVIPSKKSKILIYILALFISIGMNIVVTRNNIYEGSGNITNRRYDNRRFY